MTNNVRTQTKKREHSVDVWTNPEDNDEHRDTVGEMRKQHKKHRRHHKSRHSRNGTANTQVRKKFSSTC